MIGEQKEAVLTFNDSYSENTVAVLEEAARAASLDLSGVEVDLGTTQAILERRGEIFPEQVNQSLIVSSEEFSSYPPIFLLNYIEDNLLLYIKQILPETEIEKLIKEGLLIEEDGDLYLPPNPNPEAKLFLISALINHISETFKLPYQYLSQFQNNPIPADQFVTAIQALAAKLIQELVQELNQRQPPKPSISEETQFKKKPVVKISPIRKPPTRKRPIAHHPPAEKEIIFPVRKENPIKDNNGQETTFKQISSSVAETFTSLNQAAKNNNWEKVNNLATSLIAKVSQARDRFTRVLEKNPAAKRGIIFRLKEIIKIRINDPTIADEEKNHLQLLLKEDLSSQQNFENAINRLFNYEQHLPNFQKRDAQEVKKTAKALKRQFRQWGALIFGAEELEKKVEVDLKTAIELDDLFLPPEARLKRIKLLLEAEKLPTIPKPIAGESEEERELKTLLTSYAQEEKLANLDQLKQIKQKQRMAILNGLSVQSEDGKLMVDHQTLPEEVKNLAERVKTRYQSINQKDPLEINRQMIYQMLDQQGIRLDKDQVEALNQSLSEEGKDEKTSEILKKLGVQETDPNYPLIKAIVADGQRVSRAIVDLEKKLPEEVKNSTLSVALMGVIFSYRCQQQEVSEEVIKVPFYQLVPKAEAKGITQPEEEVKQEPLASIAKSPLKEIFIPEKL